MSEYKRPRPHVAGMYERREELLMKRWSDGGPGLSPEDEAEYARVMADIEASEERYRVKKLEAMWTASGELLGAVEALLYADGDEDEQMDRVVAACKRQRDIAQHRAPVPRRTP